MGHYATQVEQGSTESCSVEILIMMLPVLPHLSQLRLTTHADSAEYQTSCIQDQDLLKKSKNVDYCVASQCFPCQLTKEIGERSRDGIHQRLGAVCRVKKVSRASVRRGSTANSTLEAIF